MERIFAIGKAGDKSIKMFYLKVSFNPTPEGIAVDICANGHFAYYFTLWSPSISTVA